MNNNRNNRRRGRGNRGNQGGNNQNRIDSRARGNAPQLLDKYKKLAQDAQHNGDRVQAEYYLQFADHYFRVIADNKARQEEARAKRNEERGANNDDSEEDDGEGRRRGNRRGRGRRDQQEGDAQEEAVTAENSQGEAGVEGEPVSSDEENAKPKRRARKARDEGGDEASRKRTRRKKVEDTGEAGECDSSVLPPAISAGSEDDDGLEAVG